MSDHAAAPLIQLDQVSRVFAGQGREHSALREVSLHIGRGEFICLEGPSGSGKTTLLNLIGLLDRPSSGDLRLEGMEVGGLGRHRRALLRRRLLGFVFQDFSLIEVLNARENVAWSLMLRGLTGRDLWRLTDETLAAVGLAEVMHRRPGLLSGGQQQRVAVARAVAASPPILLADEPTGSLDSVTARELLDLMRSIHQTYNTTIVFSSHDPEVIRRADRVISLRDGGIVGDSKGI
ncbi:MAG: macrolide ABC transporter ATP-binding protein [Desulfobulbaceae bacterium A2]|nr:MAG: macrolide ABC transporter ATP-binding protein [Desulfobulbaceae bacterium A2]